MVETTAKHEKKEKHERNSETRAINIIIGRKKEKKKKEKKGERKEEKGPHDCPSS